MWKQGTEPVPGWAADMERCLNEGDSVDSFSNKPDGTPRHPSIACVLKHFRYTHLPRHLQDTSALCCTLAMQMADSLPENPDLTCGLRDLLAAKDNFVRAKL